jgi:uncharacterized membrane protein YhaH (DUF805 family)
MSFIDLFISFEGRIGRRAFWLGTGAVALLLWIIERFAIRLDLLHAAEIIAFAGAFAIYPWAALAAKRAVDRNRPRATGIAMVVGTVLLSLIGKAVSGGMPASFLGYLAALLWLVSFVDLGLMPSAPARIALSQDARAC